MISPEVVCLCDSTAYILSNQAVHRAVRLGVVEYDIDRHFCNGCLHGENYWHFRIG